MTQQNSTIALIAAEISHMKFTTKQAEVGGAAKGRVAVGPLGTVDDYIARQRALEELLSRYRPKSSADSAILAAQLSERAAIIRDDYASPAGCDEAFGEVDRLAAALAAWHGAPPAADDASDGTGLIGALVKDLAKAWELLEASDTAARENLPAIIDRSRLAANVTKASETIHAIETGIAAARVRTDDDARTAATLLYAETEATCQGRGRMLALGLAAFFGQAGAAEIQALRARYGPSAVASAAPPGAADGEPVAVH